MEQVGGKRHVRHAGHGAGFAIVERFQFRQFVARAARIKSPMRQTNLPRSLGVMRRHGPESKARRAAATARLMVRSRRRQRWQSPNHRRD